MLSFMRDIEVRYDTDILVAGGGPAGVAAAIAAARQGARVLLIEEQACLGGQGTAGLVPAFMQFTDGVNFLADGVGRMALERMWAIGGKVDGNPYSIRVEALKRAYDELMAETGATYLLTTRIIAVETADGLISHVVCAGKSGLFAAAARVFVDATGDADLCAWAGAPFEKGDEQGRMMAGTLCSLWAGIDWDSAKRPHARELDRAIADGVFTEPDRHLPGIWRVGAHTGGGNIGHTYGVDGTDERSLTQALIRGRRQMAEYERYYRDYLSDGFRDAELVATGAMLGIRETRRILGDYVLTLNDFKERASFGDEIGRYAYPVDIHASDSSKESFRKFHTEHTSLRYRQGESYGIPYRVLCPQGLRNVLTAGRSISADRYMQSSIRVMPGCYITGQAAGVAAALALWDRDIRGVSIPALQQRLVDMGAFLPSRAPGVTARQDA